MIERILSVQNSIWTTVDCFKEPKIGSMLLFYGLVHTTECDYNTRLWFFFFFSSKFWNIHLLSWRPHLAHLIFIVWNPIQLHLRGNNGQSHQHVFSTSCTEFPALVIILGALQYYFMWLVIMEFNAKKWVSDPKLLNGSVHSEGADDWSSQQRICSGSTYCEYMKTTVGQEMEGRRKC